MPFSRQVFPDESDAPDLTSQMVGIGMNFAARRTRNPNIENTLLLASTEAMEHDDLRVLAVLVTWFGIHAGRVNADRLIRLVQKCESPRVAALWSALGTWQARDRRFARLLRRGPRVDLLATGTEFQVRRHGEDPRFAGSMLRVPANVLRDRAADVLSPRALARRHRAYHFRLLIGPSYRADLWAALEEDPTLTPAALARQTYASFASAWQVRRDFEMLSVK